MTVAIVGGGVIGLAIAESLTRRNADVLVLDAGVCGAAASSGNMGWVTPKGYSLTAADGSSQIRGSIYLLEAKVAVSPFAGGIRLGGTLELGVEQLRLSESRVAAIKHAATSGLGDWVEETQWNRPRRSCLRR